MSFCQHVFVFAILIHFILQAFAELCNSDGIRCDGDHHCCTAGCCLNSHTHDGIDHDKRFAYGYRLSIFNMKYFWFVILFIMMTCFGGCGYYKQHQRLMGQQRVGRGWLSSVFQMPSPQQHRETTRVVAQERPILTPEAVVYGYSTGPITALTLPGNLDPPPYSEVPNIDVMNNPDLFARNVKTFMPEYQYGMPSTPSGDQTETNTTTSMLTQPPPYSDIGFQNMAERKLISQPIYSSQ